jgi:cytochrome c peroxidase
LFTSIPHTTQGFDKACAALEAIKARFPNFSYAYLYTVAGVVAVKESGGSKIPFKTGHVDFEDGSTSDLEDCFPNADYGSCNKNVGMRATSSCMGFEGEEIVALMGTHAMGCASGYRCPGTNA